MAGESEISIFINLTRSMDSINCLNQNLKEISLTNFGLIYKGDT